MSSTSVFLQEMAYPPYCLQPLKSWGMIAVGGGGGTAKTGVGNAVDLKWIDLSLSSSLHGKKCTVQNVNSFSQCDSVMRMVSLRKQHEYLILALNRHLKVVLLKASEMDQGEAFDCSTLSSTSGSAHLLDVPSSGFNVRRRRSFSASDKANSKRRMSISVHRHGQATIEAVGNETTVSKPPFSSSSSFSHPSNTSAATASSTNNIYTVPVQEHEYVNALVVCPFTQSKLFVGELPPTTRFDASPRMILGRH